MEKNKQQLQQKLEKVKDVYEARHKILTSTLTETINICASFKDKYIQALETLQFSNENISLLIDTDFSQISKTISQREDIQKKLHPKFKKYLDSKAIAKLHSLEADFSQYLNIDVLNSTQNKLIKELRGRRFIDENEANLVMDQYRIRNSIPTGNSVPKIDFGGINQNQQSKDLSFTFPLSGNRESTLTAPGNKLGNAAKIAKSIGEPEDNNMLGNLHVAFSAEGNGDSGNQILLPEKIQNFAKEFRENFGLDAPHAEQDLMEVVDHINDIIQHSLSLLQQSEGIDGVVSGQYDSSVIRRIRTKIEKLRDGINSIESKFSTIAKGNKENGLELKDDEISGLYKALDQISQESSSLFMFEIGGKTLNEFMQDEINCLTKNIEKQNASIEAQVEEYTTKTAKVKELMTKLLKSEKDLEMQKMQITAYTANIQKVQKDISAKDLELQETELSLLRVKSESDIEQERLKMLQNKIREISKEIFKENENLETLKLLCNENKLELLDVYKEKLTTLDMIEEETSRSDMFKKKAEILSK